MATDKSENEAIIQASLAYGEVQLNQLQTADDPTIGHDIDLADVPTNRSLKSVKAFIDEYRIRPERMKGTAQVTTIQSFVDQVNRFKDPNSTIFADTTNRAAPVLLCVLNYNESTVQTNAVAAGSVSATPRFGDHRVRYPFPVSEEWKAWTAKIENIGQVEFAEFLEARIMDVIDPASVSDKEGQNVLKSFCQQLGITLGSPQRLLELSRGLVLHADHRVVQAINLTSGEAQIGFTDEHSPKDGTGAPVKIPGGFAIGIPVFRDGPPYQIPVRLMYRAREGSVKWTLKPQRLEEIFDDAVKEAVGAVTTKTGLPTIFGVPES